MSIPKKIHYCWFGGKPLDEMAEKCIASWQKQCPDYEIIRHDETNFDVNRLTYMKEAYDAKKWAFVTDAARLYIVLEEGGIYLDTDVEIVKSFDALLENQAFFGMEEPGVVNTGLGFGAEPNSPFVKALLDSYSGIHFKQGEGIYNLIPCPQRNTQVLIAEGMTASNEKQLLTKGETAAVIYPTEYFCPRDYRTGKLNLMPNTFSIHWFGASWIDDDSKANIEKAEAFQKKHGRLLSFLYWRVTDYRNAFGRFNLKSVLKFSVSQVKFYMGKIIGR